MLIQFSFASIGIHLIQFQRIESALVEAAKGVASRSTAIHLVDDGKERKSLGSNHSDWQEFALSLDYLNEGFTRATTMKPEGPEGEGEREREDPTVAAFEYPPAELLPNNTRKCSPVPFTCHFSLHPSHSNSLLELKRNYRPRGGLNF